MCKINEQDDQRWSTRRRVEIGAHLTDALGLAFDATLINISEDGFAIHTVVERDFTRDAVHTMRVLGLEPRTAQVVWSRHGIAGFVFCEPLSPAVVQGLIVKSMHIRLIGRFVHATR